MICPKCNSKIVNGCCIRCGYIDSGNKIQNGDMDIDKYSDMKMFNKDFDKLNRNKNSFVIFLLGPLYFSYMGYFFIGTVLGLIDYLLFYILMNNTFIFSFVFITYLYIFLNRIIYVVFSNYICILIDKYKIKRIKKKYKDNYLSKLKKYKHHKIYLLFTMLLYILIILIFAVVKRYQNGML